MCIIHLAPLYEGWHTDLFPLKNSTKHFSESMSVKKKKPVKLTTSTDLGLIRTCAGAHADGIPYSSEEVAETARGFVARGRGPRSKAMHYLLTGACHVVSVDSGNGRFDRYVTADVAKTNTRSYEGSPQEFVARILRMFTNI